MNFSNSEVNHNDWQSCPEGELIGLGQRLNGVRRRRNLRFAAASITLVLVTVVATWAAFDMPWSLPLSRDVAGIDCRTCKSQLVAFEHGELPPAEERRVREHLEGCEWCRWYQRWAANSPTNDTERIGRSWAQHGGQSVEWSEKQRTAMELALAAMPRDLPMPYRANEPCEGKDRRGDACECGTCNVKRARNDKE